MYDPLDFASGIDRLAEAEGRGDLQGRRAIIELMLADLGGMAGNLHRELVDYLARLYLFAGDPVDFDKLGTLHAELAAIWGSSTGYRLEQEAERVEALLPSAVRGDKVIKGASLGGGTRSIWKQKEEEMQQAVDSICADKPQHSYERVKELVSQVHGYPMCELKRYTKNPHKK